MPRTILLDGQRLTRRDFSAVVLENHRVGLSPRARVAMRKSRAWVEKIIAEKQVVYGVTTGVGSLSTEHIDPAAARELQLNVVRSHCCGVGKPLGTAETRGLHS
jgi:histidine ammonia-lyase